MAREKTPPPALEAKPLDLDSHVRPFLKWAGGKRQLLPQIRRFYPESFGAYYEPFVGSGAVFFDLYTRGLLAGRQAVLMDNNADLVGCYLMVRDQVDAVIQHLRELALAYRADPRAHYYSVRDEQFNPERHQIFNGDAPKSSRYTPALAAKLIYLNRTGFNGLFRVNSQGQFNVPLGRYTNPRICDRTNLQQVARALAETRADICQAPFQTVLDRAQPGDFAYFDPPYAPLSRTALFTSYTADRFSLPDQQRLQQVTIELARRGCWVLLSNSTASEIADLYDGNREAKAAGLSAYQIPARRAINSDATGRGQILEYLITNLPRHDETEGHPQSAANFSSNGLS
ncbi:MAG: Dam family site-specific DNA-(adenine-N6)-methyltransferase [Luteitalea sp.]|nr:Dam family site-specific DNA-(adenine-N6)-methyltransferase [Luteitalea sp.]